MTMTLAGRLEMRGREDCDCCGEVRDVVTLELNFVLLARTGSGEMLRRELHAGLC
jgi:hypothetical protein